MHFGIKSAPEAFQRRIHEVVEGLSGVEVVADDFMVVGFGEMEANARGNHNEQLEVFYNDVKKKICSMTRNSSYANQKYLLLVMWSSGYSQIPMNQSNQNFK